MALHVRRQLPSAASMSCRALEGYARQLSIFSRQQTCMLLAQGISGGVKAARAGHQVIMTPTSHCYLDYRQSLRAGEPGAWCKHCSPCAVERCVTVKCTQARVT